MALPLSYHWRSLFARRTTTLLTILVIASVVAVFAWMLGFTLAIRSSLSLTSDPRTLIVLKRGATAESNSALPIPEYNKLTQLSGVARDEHNGQPLISAEMITQVSLPRVRDSGSTNANISVRGVTESAFQVHRNIALASGRLFDTGVAEVIVGTAAARQFRGLGIGEKINLGAGNNRPFTIVGHFSAAGGPMESEIWGYRPLMMDAYNRSLYSSANVRLKDDADPAAVIAEIEGPSIQLTAQTETAYWQNQSRFMEIYLSIAYVLVTIMCLAAVFSIANTMFASVAGRVREIAMLRTIGFSGRQILQGFLLEALLLSLIGGLAGCAACAGWLTVAGSTKDMFGATTFTTLAFDIRLTPSIVLICLVSVGLVGVVGAMVPACRAARLRIVNILREA